MKIVAITQARISSTRLPGKVMKKIKNKPILQYHVDQILKSKLINEVVVATSKNKEDSVIYDYCLKKNIHCFRGSLKDVLSRYYYCAKKYNADIIVRVTSDCPLIDPKIIDKCIKLYKEKNYDYVSNTNPPENATYPDGTDVEILNYSTLEYAFNNCKDRLLREHVTHFFWKNPKKFKIFRLDLSRNLRRFRFTVDYQEDFLLIKKVLNNFVNNNIKITLSNIIYFLRKNKKIKSINNIRNLDLKKN